MSEQPFMQFWIADFLGDTLHLSAEEVGQYMLLLMASWRAGGSFTAERGALSRVCRGPVSDAVLAFFEEKDGRIVQKRLLAELVRAKQLSNIRRAAGSKGGKARALKNNDEPQANASAKRKPTSSIPEPQPLATNVANREAREARSPAKGTRIPDDWMPNDATIEWARREGFSDAVIAREIETMRDWALANQHRAIARKSDWNLTFKNWLKKVRDRGGHGPPRLSKTQQAAKEIEEELGRGNIIDIGSGRRDLREPRGEHAALEPPASSPRSQDTHAPAYGSLHGRAQGGVAEDG